MSFLNIQNILSNIRDILMFIDKQNFSINKKRVEKIKIYRIWIVRNLYSLQARVIHKENFRLHIENTFFFGFFHLNNLSHYWSPFTKTANFDQIFFCLKNCLNLFLLNKQWLATSLTSSWSNFSLKTKLNFFKYLDFIFMSS